MKCLSVRPVSLLFAPLLVFTACGGGGISISSSGSLPNYTLHISPQPASIPVNTTVTFMATTNDSNPDIICGVVNQGNGVNSGSPVSQIGGMTFTYTAPSAPPIFDGTTIPAGSVTVQAEDVGSAEGEVQLNIVITAPSIATGFNSPPTTVALGKTATVWAYAVGSVYNAITMQVNGAPGGSTTYGTITPVPMGFYGEYTYTAPATMPMTGNTVTVTVISQTDPTKTSSTTITLM
jgi:hypothetical protein